jgi:hypothetical protein
MKTVLIVFMLMFLVGCEEFTSEKGVASNGASGSQGQKGEKGNPGDVGPAGPQGIQGLQGLPGVAGPAGAKGANGAQGAAGLNGAQGAPGVAGPKGDKGLTGDKGATGSIGPIGPQGLPGKDGKDGDGSFNSIVKFTRQSNLTSCDHASGAVISSGLDENDNGILDGNEVLTTSYVCDGKCYNCSDDDDGCGKTKVYVCHKDCKSKSKTLYLPQSAVQAHLNHGDKLGKCN